MSAFPVSATENREYGEGRQLDVVTEDGKRYEKINAENRYTLEEIMKMSEEERQILELPDPRLLFSNVRSATSYSIVVPTYQQKNGYYCGPAAVLQLLYREGKYSTIAGSTASAKQDSLAAQLGTTRDGTATAAMPSVINNYSDRVREWTCMHVDDNSSDRTLLVYYMNANFSNNHATIYLVNTRYLKYYGSTKLTHFITGSGVSYESGSTIDYANINMEIVDPNYDDKYEGKHTVSFEEMIDAMESTISDNFVY